MLQLILIFYGPGIWLGHNIWGSQRMLACTVAFVLNYACLLLRHLPGRH